MVKDVKGVIGSNHSQRRFAVVQHHARLDAARAQGALERVVKPLSPAISSQNRAGHM
jgi:hypothetical protein